VGFFNRELGIGLTDDKKHEDEGHNKEEDGGQGDALFL
jgi:hypothetical protein